MARRLMTSDVQPARMPVPHVRSQQIVDFRFDMPPLEEQRSVAARLGEVLSMN